MVFVKLIFNNFVHLIDFKKNMEEIKKKYIIDESSKKVAVQIDINDFEKIEQLIEDYALGKYMEENDPIEVLTLNEAKVLYEKMKIEARGGSTGK
jgi:hypothetical protein